MKLFCLPYAGASATVYSKLKKMFNSEIEVIPLELPGRGTRVREPLKESIHEMVDSIFDMVNKEIGNDTKYAIFGHSMGGLIAYELYYRLFEDERIKSKPVHVFFSGCKPAHIRDENEEIYKLPLEEFKEKILTYGLATSHQLFEDELLVEFFLPIIRADFKAVETYKYKKKDQLITVDITSFVGLKDQSMSVNDANAWQELTMRNCTVHKFSGGHFFINESLKAIVDIIQNKLLEV